MDYLTITYRELFMRHTERLFATFIKHTGVPQSAISTAVGGNSQFLDQIRKHSQKVSTHDAVLENFSALWPKDVEWPEDIPRPDPQKATLKQLSQEKRDNIAHRRAKHLAAIAAAEGGSTDG